MKSSNNDSSDGENADTDHECELWLNINYQMDEKNVSGDARKKRGFDVVLYYLRCVSAWHHDRI